MPRGLRLFTTIVAAFQLHAAAAAPVSENAPVAPDLVVRARALGIDVVRDRARFVDETARLLLTPPEWRSPILPDASGAPAESVGTSEPIIIPVPLSASLWSDAVFGRPVAVDELVDAIFADRRATMLAYSLAALDDDTLTFLAENPPLLTYLYQSAPEVFAGFGSSLRVSSGRVLTPGGEEAVALWEAVVGERVDRPVEFAVALYTVAGGRIAYLYDTIAQLDSARARFALGLWMTDPAVRLARFRELAAFCTAAYSDWRFQTQPLSRPQNDLGLLLARMAVLPSGAPAPPVRRAFWSDVFTSSDPPGKAGGSAPPGQAAEVIDAAWIAAATDASTWFARGDRFDQLAFGQRVFARLTDAQVPDAVLTLRALPRQRMLLIELERMGVGDPAVLEAAAARARTLRGDPSSVFWTLAQFQGALAIISRMADVGTIGEGPTTALVKSLVAVRGPSDARYSGALAGWLERELLPLMPLDDSAEARVIDALAGPPPSATAPVVEWEGESYRLDFAGAERRRLEKVRARQGGFTLDTALALERLAMTAPQSAPDVRVMADRLTTLAPSIPRRATRQLEDMFAPAVHAPRYGREWVEKTAGELSGGKGKRIPSQTAAARVPGSLHELADVALGEALISFAYAASIGSPGGSALLGINVALRHDFGFNIRDTDTRTSRPWSVPRQDILPGEPWRVSGSLLGMDLALATLALQRLDLDRNLEVPRLSGTEREAFAVSRSLLNPRRLTDRDRDAIADAIDAGRERVHALRSRADADAASSLLDLDGWRRRALNWTIAQDPGGIDHQFSLADLLAIGGGAPGVDLDAWGMSALYLTGCACTRFVPSRQWHLLSGRPQLPLMTASMPDLNLRMATALRDLQLPAALAPPVLGAALADFMDRTKPTDSNDWWALSATAQEITRRQVEDYVAAAALVGGPLVPVNEGEAEP